MQESRICVLQGFPGLFFSKYVQAFHDTVRTDEALRSGAIFVQSLTRIGFATLIQIIQDINIDSELQHFMANSCV